MFNQLFRSILLLSLFSFQTFLSSAPLLPEMDPKGAKLKLNEIMSSHATYKQLNTTLVQRALQNFLDELDPLKSYFILPEIEKWASPSDLLLEQVLKDYEEANYSTFEEIFQLMQAAIKRRDTLEELVKNTALPKDVETAEFKDLTWVKNEEELFKRLLRMRALQVETIEKLDEENKEISMQRLEKRRIKEEEEYLNPDPIFHQRFLLSLVLKATAAALDAHTVYFTPSEAEQFLIQVQQRLSGLGVQIRDDLNGFTIVKIIEGGPAAQEGKLQVNDLIIGIDGASVVGMDVSEVVEFIRGEEGTSVLLTVLRDSKDNSEKDPQKLNILVKRGEVVLKESRFESHVEPFGYDAIGYVKLYSFYQDPQSSSTSDIFDAIVKMKKENVIKGLILDLRDNSGGILPQAVSVAGLFITKGVVVSVKDSSGFVQHLRDIDGKTAWDGPLIILINRLSASASEIVAQTLQDYGRAILVGDDHTFGKGTFQTFTLDATRSNKIDLKGEYKVTRGKYYTVSGKTPQLVGVLADIEVPGSLSTLDVGEKYGKYPLENDQIPPNFNDNLSDIPFFQRDQILKVYRNDLQPKLTLYMRYLGRLKDNSAVRLKENKTYQKFLSELKKTHPNAEFFKAQAEADFQYTESVNIMKDLIFMMQSDTKEQKK